MWPILRSGPESNTERDRQRAGRHQGKNRSRLQLRFPRTPKWNSEKDLRHSEMQIPKMRNSESPKIPWNATSEKQSHLSQTPLQHQQIFSQWILSNNKSFLETNFYSKPKQNYHIHQSKRPFPGPVANSTSTSGRWGRWCVTGVPVGFAGGYRGKAMANFGYKTYP